MCGAHVCVPLLLQAGSHRKQAEQVCNVCMLCRCAAATCNRICAVLCCAVICCAALCPPPLTAASSTRIWSYSEAMRMSALAITISIRSTSDWKKGQCCGGGKGQEEQAPPGSRGGDGSSSGGQSRAYVHPACRHSQRVLRRACGRLRQGTV